MCALFRWIFFIFPLLCVLVLLIESYDENLTITFISYSNGLTLIYRILNPFTFHLHVDSWYDVTWLWWWFLRSAFKHHFNRFSETFTEYCKKYCSLQQNKEHRSSGWVVFSLSGRKWSSALHMMQTPWGWPGPWEASFVLQFNILIKEWKHRMRRVTNA